MASVILTGTLFPGTLAQPYAYLPFEVPEGTTRLSVRYRYDEGNVIDLGVFDPRIVGENFPATQGFRGWSGGARDGFFISRDDATPGYLAGDLPPGRWFIMLGLYRVQSQGCAYRVEVALETEPQGTPAQPRTEKRRLVRDGAGWYRGDLHTHTHHSDAKGSLRDLARAAEARGLEFLTVTDHNTVSHHRELAHLDTPLLLVPGQELTTSRGHANVWGDTGWIDFRLTHDADLPGLVEHVHNRGGLFSVNHPKDTGHNWHYPVPERFDALEVWQSAWAYRNWESVALADTLLKQGRRFTFVGGSDRHQPGWSDTDPPFLQVGTPTTWVYLEAATPGAVLGALRRGRSCVSEGPAGPWLELTVAGVPMGGTVSRSPQPQPVEASVTGAAGCTLRYLSGAGVVRVVEVPDDAFTDTWWWRPEGRFLRAEVVAELVAGAEETRLELSAAGVTLSDAQLADVLAKSRLRALSNPVFISNSEPSGA